jgi:hypothetical protein
MTHKKLRAYLDLHCSSTIHAKLSHCSLLPIMHDSAVDELLSADSELGAYSKNRHSLRLTRSKNFNNGTMVKHADSCEEKQASHKDKHLAQCEAEGLCGMSLAPRYILRWGLGNNGRSRQYDVRSRDVTRSWLESMNDIEAFTTIPAPLTAGFSCGIIAGSNFLLPSKPDMSTRKLKESQRWSFERRIFSS